VPTLGPIVSHQVPTNNVEQGRILDDVQSI
jgi:hypothetical protein